VNLSITLACIWVVVACIGAMFPSKKSHWPFAYGLIAIGIPVLGFVTYQNGPWVGLAAMLAGASILRWPVRYLWRWMRQRLPGRDEV
jgi:hypothetical protein